MLTLVTTIICIFEYCKKYIMEKFYKRQIRRDELVSDRRMVKLSDCISLIQNSEFKEDLFKLFDFEKIKNEVITISGLKKIVNLVIDLDDKFTKIDIDIHLSNVILYSTNPEGGVILRLNNVEEKFGIDHVDVQTVYNSQYDFFDGGYKMDKFAKFCIENGHVNVIKSNVEYLNNENRNSEKLFRNFRLIKDSDSTYYLRAITSISSYHDYNVRFSLFVTIVAIYQMQSNTAGASFQVTYCEYSESHIRLFLEKDGSRIIDKVGKISFVLEMSNDEIKREAFKFSGLFNLEVNDSNGNSTVVSIKPRQIKTKLISIKHNFLPSTVIENISKLSQFIEDAESEMIEDIKDINNLKSPDQLRFTLLRSLERSSTLGLKEFKGTIKKALDKKIYSISELILLMDKVNSIVTNIELKEYLRYLFYDILRDRKK